MNGTVYISQREPGTVVMLKETDRDGGADVQKVIAEKKQAHGLAIDNNNWLYLVTVKELYAAEIKPDGTVGAYQGKLEDQAKRGSKTVVMPK